LRSNAGLYYANAAEFAAVMDRVLTDRLLAERLGRMAAGFMRSITAGRHRTQNISTVSRLSSNPPAQPMEKLPRLARAAPAVAWPAAQVLDELPSVRPCSGAARGAIA